MICRANRLAVVAFSLLSPATSASRASADAPSPPRVSVALVGCDPSLAGEVQRIVGIELRAVVVDPGAPGAPLTRAVVSCRDDVADLTVADAVTSKVVSRSVAVMQAVPAARGRLLALAVAELVAASWEEVVSNPAPKVPAPVSTPPEARASVRRVIVQRRQRAEFAMGEAAPPITLDATVDARAFFDSGALLWGGDVHGHVPLGRALALRLGAGADYGEIARSLGSVTVMTLQGSAAVGWALDRILMWAGAVAGFARVGGQPHPNAIGRVESGPWIGPEVGLDVALWPRAPVHATVGAAAGAALLGVKGDVDRDADVAVLGAWAALRLGFGISSGRSDGTEPREEP